MRIAIFTDTFYPQTNGVSHFVINSAESLAQRGHEIKIFAVLSNRAKKNFRALDHKFEVENIPSVSVNFVYPGERFSLPLGWSFRKLKKFNPHIIHSHTLFAAGIEAILGSKILKIPLVGEHHTFYDHYLKHIKMDYGWAKKASWKITAAYYNRCHAVISPTQSLADDLVRSGMKKNVRIISNGIDTDLFVPLEENKRKEIKKLYSIDDLSVVYMGRISYEKSIDRLIAVFSKLIKNNKLKNAKLMLIGDGPEKIKLKKLARKLNIEKNIIWTGVLRGHKLAQAVACNDIFATASKSENMPLSVLEAMACGLPMVTAKDNGLKEIIKNNHNGYLCDNEDEMARKMKELLEDSGKRGQFGKASREMALDYSKDKIMKLFEECYREVIKNFK